MKRDICTETESDTEKESERNAPTERRTEPTHSQSQSQSHPNRPSLAVPPGRTRGTSGSSDGWPGDLYFDGPPAKLVSEQGFRQSGAQGLLLFHIVHKDAQGRSKTGKQRPFHTPAIGIAIPAGGPALSVVVNFAL